MTCEILLGGYPASFSRGWLGWSTVALIRTGEENILFDTGAYNDRPVLLERLERRGLTPDRIDTVVLSHLHFDHVMNVDLFGSARILASDIERKGCLSGEPDPATPAWYLQRLLDCPRVEWVEGRQALGKELTLLPLPGHTPGSCGLLAGQDGRRVLFAGDAVKYRSEFLQAQPGSAVRRLGELADVIVPGHDRPFDNRGEWADWAVPPAWLELKNEGGRRLALDPPV